ncbi:MAG: phosphoribosyltransferase family protein [Candidatus Uhrbacteria bacterium]
MAGIVQRVLDGIADIVAPRVCAGCGDEGVWLCLACAQNLKYAQYGTCFRCQRLSVDGVTCDQCARHFSINGVTTLVAYHIPVVRRIIQTAKYAPARDVCGAFVTLLECGKSADRLARVLCTEGRDHCESVLLVPIPPGAHSERRRGFNQSAIIARELETLGVGTYCNALERTRQTSRQASLTREKRLTNVIDAFACRQNVHVQGSTVVIVDDVATTGSTLLAASEALRAAGAKVVWGFAIARG